MDDAYKLKFYRSAGNNHAQVEAHIKSGNLVIVGATLVANGWNNYRYYLDNKHVTPWRTAVKPAGQRECTYNFSLYDDECWCSTLGVQELSDEFFSKVIRSANRFHLQRGANSTAVRKLFGEDSEIRRLLALKPVGKKSLTASLGRVEFHYVDRKLANIDVWFAPQMRYSFAVKHTKDLEIWNDEKKDHEIVERNDIYDVRTGVMYSHKVKELIAFYCAECESQKAFIVSYKTKEKGFLGSMVAGNRRNNVVCGDWKFSALPSSYSSIKNLHGFNIAPLQDHQNFLFIGPQRTYLNQVRKLSRFLLPENERRFESPINHTVMQEDFKKMISPDTYNSTLIPVPIVSDLIPWTRLPNYERYFYAHIQAIIEFVLVMSPFNLPIYIIDLLLWTLNETGWRHDVKYLFVAKRITTIQSVSDSIKVVRGARERGEQTKVARRVYSNPPETGVGSNMAEGMNLGLCKLGDCGCTSFVQPRKTPLDRCDICRHGADWHTTLKRDGEV
jgi:hypothetical protein